MRISIILIFSLILVFFEVIMFKISLELGLSSLILISTIFCIWFVLKKITTIVLQPDFALDTDPFRNSKKTESTIQKANGEKTLDSTNLIPGFDGSIFERFKNNLNLKSSSKNTSSENLQNENYVKNLTDNPDIIKDQNNFSEELNEKEQIRVTLSKSAKNLNKLQSEIINENNINLIPGLDEFSNGKNISSFDSLGSGEEALKILSSKQEALRNQTGKKPSIDRLDFEKDIFEDELIPIPGGENFSEKETEFSNNNKTNENSENSYFLEEEEFLEDSITNNQTDSEKISEAEDLLKLATTACESGRIEEAKESLKIYLDLLNEVNQVPSPNVKQLLKKLDITLKSKPLNKENDITNEENSETNLKTEPILQDLPEQANYANVMDGLVKSLEEKESYEEALPLLMDLIEYNKKRGNISDMDPLYDRIEQAYSSLKNDKKLVSAYKEHLSIKQQLKDLEGELHLLDLISYYYANIGDQKSSKNYQAESQRVKKILEKKITSERKNL